MNAVRKKTKKKWFYTGVMTVLLLGNYMIVPMQVLAEESSSFKIEEAATKESTSAMVSGEAERQQSPESTTSSLNSETALSESFRDETSKSPAKVDRPSHSDQTEQLSNTDEWSATTNGQYMVIQSYSGDLETIEVPSEIEGLPVQIDLEAVLGTALQKTTKTFSIERAKNGLSPVKITGTFRGLFASVDIGGGVEGLAPIESVSFGDADTSAITDMSYMFAQCESLSTLDIKELDTQNVQTMLKMFSYCKGLTELALTNFDTGKVTSMARMFENASNLISIDVTSFVTENVTDFSYMFRYCGSVKSLDLQKFNTKNGENMQSMFDRCHSLTTLDLSSFNTINVENMSYMFGNCKELIDINMENFDTSNVMTMFFMFANCHKLASLDLSHFDTRNVTTMSYMFAGCDSLTDLKISYFNTSMVSDMSYMFHLCSELATLDLTNFNTVSVTYGTQVFGGCNKLTSLTLGSDFTLSSNYGLLELPIPSNGGRTTTHWVQGERAEVYDSTKDFREAHNQIPPGVVHTYTIQRKHLVTFDLAGGSGELIPDQRIFENGLVADPQYAGRKAHYRFTGWRVGGLSYSFATEVIAPLELTADWLVDTYSVKFHANTGEGAMPEQTFEYDEEKRFTLNSYFKLGFTFNGWNSAADGQGEKSYSDGELVKNLSLINGETIDLYAQWLANTYSILFEANGGTGSMVPLEMTYDKSKMLTENRFIKKGYQFINWNTAQNGQGTSYENQESVQKLTVVNEEQIPLYAQWKMIDYNVAFDSQGGSTISDRSYTVEQGIDSFAVPHRNGYNFLGWYEGETKIESIPTGEIGDRTLKAKWQTNQYKVTFDSNGGSAIASQNYTIEKGLESFEAPKRSGYNFIGWYDGEAKVGKISIGETGDRVLAAKWEIVEYTLTFDDPSISPIPYTVESETIRLPALTKTGYRFLGWLVSENTLERGLTDSGKIVQEIQTGTTGNLKLLAQWQANQYKISFDPNDGTDERVVQTMNYDERAKLSANIFTRADYVFINWNTQPDGQGTRYLDAQEVQNLVAESDGSVTLYAQWKPTKTALDDLVNKEKETKRVKENYTEDSWKKYEEALKKAEEALANEEATSEQIHAALEELTATIANLKPLETASGKSTSSTSPSSATQKTYPTSTAKSYPKSGMIVMPGLTMVGLLMVGASLVVWKKKQDK